MKIVQFGLCYSPNLGDGIIADCIGYAAKARNADAQVTHIDLSARQGFGQVMIRNREAIIAVIDHLPLFLRQKLAIWKLNRLIDGVVDSWHTAAQADLAIVGGGQIFSDANLNFPVKISRAFEVIAKEGTPCVVYGVGVSQNWTPQAKCMFGSLRETDMRMVGVRDTGSQAAWNAQMSNGPAPEITLDPGLFAAAHYGPATEVEGVGLCVTDFGILAHHADGSVAGAASSAVDFYVGIAQQAIAKGHKVKLFCNGAAEDVTLLDKVTVALAAESIAGNIIVPTAPTTPTALAAIIASCEAVIAHRLHACIVAYSYQRPIVGLGWDAKLESFFKTAGVADGFSADPTMTATDVVGLLEAAIANGIAPADHQNLLDQAWDGIDRILACAKTAPASA